MPFDPPFDPINHVRRTQLVPGGTSLRTEPLPGGNSNDSARVIGVGIDWVIKRYRQAQSESLFPNLPEAEARALTVLEDMVVAPQLVAYRPGEIPVLVYEYYPGARFDADVNSVAEVALLLRRVHATPAARLDGFRSLPTSGVDIVAQGDRFAARVADGGAPFRDVDDLLAQVRDARPSVSDGPAAGAPVLVHTDVGAGNLIVGARGARLIDWQCPGLGDAAEDLWGFLSPAFQIIFGQSPLGAGQRARFLDAYGDEGARARLAHLGPAFRYRMVAYCAWRARSVRPGDPALAARYLAAAAAELARVGH